MSAPGPFSPLREHNFARLWVAQVVSDAGEWVNYMALTAVVWNLTGSAWMLAVLRACHAVPLLVLGLFSGVLVDRLNRKTTLVTVNVLRAGLVLLFPLARDMTDVLLVTIAFNMVSTCFAPAKNALIPQIVGRDRLLAANSLSSTTRNMAMVMGPAIGGAIMAISGTAACFYLNSATFVFAAAAIASMSLPKTSAAARSRGADVRRELLEGFHFASSHSAVRSALLLEIGLMLGWGSVNFLAILIAEQVLGGGPTEYGLLLTSVGIGSMAGAFFAGSMGGRIGLGRLFPIGFVVVGISIAGLAGSHVFIAAAAAYFLGGVGRTITEVAAATIYQRSVPDGLLGRVFSLRHMATHLALLASNQLSGAFTDAASIVPILLVAAVAEFCCALLSRSLMADVRQQEQPG